MNYIDVLCALCIAALLPEASSSRNGKLPRRSARKRSALSRPRNDYSRAIANRERRKPRSADGRKPPSKSKKQTERPSAICGSRRSAAPGISPEKRRPPTTDDEKEAPCARPHSCRKARTAHI